MSRSRVLLYFGGVLLALLLPTTYRLRYTQTCLSFPSYRTNDLEHQDRAGVALIPPTFRMYTTGDIFDAFGDDAVVRSRDIASEETSRGTALEEVEGSSSDDSSSTASDISGSVATGPRREIYIAEIQVTWVDGYTHVLGWLDSNGMVS